MSLPVGDATGENALPRVWRGGDDGTIVMDRGEVSETTDRAASDFGDPDEVEALLPFGKAVRALGGVEGTICAAAVSGEDFASATVTFCKDRPRERPNPLALGGVLGGMCVDKPAPVEFRRCCRACVAVFPYPRGALPTLL